MISEKLNREAQQKAAHKARVQEAWIAALKERDQRSKMLRRDKAVLRMQAAKHDSMLDARNAREEELMRVVSRFGTHSLLRALSELHILDDFLQPFVTDDESDDEAAPLSPITSAEVIKFLREENDLTYKEQCELSRQEALRKRLRILIISVLSATRRSAWMASVGFQSDSGEALASADERFRQDQSSSESGLVRLDVERSLLLACWRLQCQAGSRLEHWSFSRCAVFA